MSSPLVPQPACPVCGDHFDGEPTRCDRCDTPHHQECWEYVPGCAIFGCEEQAPPPALSRPWTHRLILLRARLSSFNANLIQLTVLAFGAAVGAGTLPQPLLMFVMLCLGLLCFSLPTHLAVEVAYWMSPARAALNDALSQGDRRLQAGIERQSGRLIQAPSWAVAWVMGTMLVLPPFFRDLWAILGSGNILQQKLFVILFCLPVVGGALGLMVWPILALCERWVGAQQVLLRRLEAARGLPEKPGKG